MKKRFFALLLTAALAAVMVVPAPAGAADATQEAAAQALHGLGLFTGRVENGGIDYALDDEVNRVEAAIMQLRLMGKENKAKAQFNAGNVTNPFRDVPAWAAYGITWLYENSYVNGSGGSQYSPDAACDAQQYAVMMLRTLGYSDSGSSPDFAYADAIPFAVQKGVLTSAQASEYQQRFTRGCMVVMSYQALQANMRDSNRTLQTKLTYDGVFDADDGDTAISNAAPLTLSVKYKGGGHYDNWSIEPATQCAPVAADVNKDGRLELVYSGLSLFCMDAGSGNVLWKVNAGKDRNTPWTAYGGDGRTDLTAKVLDIDGDGSLEIINVSTNYSASRSCIAVYDCNGYFKPGWPKYQDKPVYALHVTDFDNDGRSELCVGLGTGGEQSPALYIYEPDGSTRGGWPLTCGYGLFSDSMASLDLDGDGKKELVLLYDDQFVCAYHGDGSPVTATGGVYSGLNWNGVPVCETMEYEAICADWARRFGGVAFASGSGVLGDTREERNCMVGTYSGLVADDLDGNGSLELACTGLIVDGGLLMRNGGNTYSGVARYFTAFILNTDRTRYTNAAKGFDWTQMPTDTGEIITFDVTMTPKNIPVTADVDGDGNKEILYSSSDGMVHCWNLDGTEHGAWPYNLDSRSSQALTFATIPACGDVNGDGKAEVVFATYVQSDQLAARGALYVLDGTGKVLSKVELPPIWGADADTLVNGPNMCRAQPCIADLDGDGKMEIAVTTYLCGVVVYDVN